MVAPHIKRKRRAEAAARKAAAEAAAKKVAEETAKKVVKPAVKKVPAKDPLEKPVRKSSEVNDKILLVGTSADTNNFDKNYFEQAREDGYRIFSYADSLLHLESMNFMPDYWTFVDPLCLSRFYDRFENEYFSQIELITPNLYSNKFKNFFKVGYTCGKLRKQKKIYDRILSMNLSSYFKKHTVLDYNVVRYSENIPHEYDMRSQLYLFHRTTGNQCKFSHNILPLVFFHFNDCKHIKSIGFGHYDIGRNRDSNLKDGYKDYKISFEVIKDVVKANIEQNDIDLEFDGKKSHFECLITKEQNG